MFVDLRVEVAVDAGYDKGWNKKDVTVVPDVVGEVVVIAPVYRLQHVVNMLQYMILTI
jgi:hypothetical protein